MGHRTGSVMLAFLLCWLGVAMAHDAPLTIEVDLVLASDGGVVDPELRALKGKLSMLRYTGYQKVGEQTSRVVEGESLVVALRDGQELQVRLLSHDDRSARLRIRRVRGDQVLADQTVNVHRDDPLVAGGQRVPEGQLLHPITVTW